MTVTVQRDQGKKPLVIPFGGIPLTRKRTAIMTDLKPIMATVKRNELIHRLLAGRCELCEEEHTTPQAQTPVLDVEDGASRASDKSALLRDRGDRPG